MFQYKINDELSLTLVHSSFASQMNDIVNDQKDDLVINNIIHLTGK